VASVADANSIGPSWRVRLHGGQPQNGYRAGGRWRNRNPWNHVGSAFRRITSCVTSFVRRKRIDEITVRTERLEIRPVPEAEPGGSRLEAESLDEATTERYEWTERPPRWKHEPAPLSTSALWCQPMACQAFLSTACSSESASPVEASMDCGNLQRKSTEQDGVR